MEGHGGTPGDILGSEGCPGQKLAPYYSLFLCLLQRTMGRVLPGNLLLQMHESEALDGSSKVREAGHWTRYPLCKAARATMANHSVHRRSSSLDLAGLFSGSCTQVFMSVLSEEDRAGSKASRSDIGATRQRQRPSENPAESIIPEHKAPSASTS